jgi:gluconate 2-dehydrogenase alpha chain
VGKHVMAHIGARVFVAFDDRFVNIYMGPSAQKHSLDDFNADNFDHGGQRFIRGAQISITPADLEAGPIGAAMAMNPPPGVPRWGAAYRDFLATYFARHAALVAQTENLPYADQTIDLDPNVRDTFGLPAPRPDLRLAPPERNGAHRVPASASSKNWDARWAPRMSGARPRARARPARTTRAARAWAAIPKHRW